MQCLLEFILMKCVCACVLKDVGHCLCWSRPRPGSLLWKGNQLSNIEISHTDTVWQQCITHSTVTQTTTLMHPLPVLLPLSHAVLTGTMVCLTWRGVRVMSISCWPEEETGLCRSGTQPTPSPGHCRCSKSTHKRWACYLPWAYHHITNVTIISIQL